MILNPKEKPYFHPISLDCLKKLVDCIGRFNKGEIDADTSCQMEKQILTDEIQDTEFLEFAIKNYPFFLSPMSYTPAAVERKS